MNNLRRFPIILIVFSVAILLMWALFGSLSTADSLSASDSLSAAEENALNLSQSTRRVIESRLERLGLQPGRVDGTFDDDTRRAIRRYQSARNLDETGYVNEPFVVQILADSVRSIFR